MKSPEYEIRTVEDFAQIAPEKLDQVLSDFKEWIALYKQQLPEIQKLRDAGAIVDMKLTWVDDGIEGVSEVHVNYHYKKQPAQ